MPLTRLTSLARLTPSQALELAAGVLAEAARGEEPDPGGEPVLAGEVVVGTDGRVALRTAADGGPPAGGPAVAVVLADLGGAARVRGRPVDPAAEQLLTRLERAGADLRVAGVPAVARTLGEAAAALDRGAVRAELAALVRAVGGTAAGRGASGGGAGPARVASPEGREAPATKAATGGSRTARRRIGAWLLSVLVLGAVVAVEVAVLRDDIATDVALLLDAGRSGAPPSTEPEPDGPPVVPPAPPAAGAVTGVDLRPLDACTPGAPCSVRLLVRLAPAPDPQVVTWSYQVVDRCTSAAQTAPGGTVTVPAGAERAEAVGTVALPAVAAAAVVAVTEQPAVAASPPVFAGSCLPDPRAG
ncbi:hypothetical protein ACI789_23735 [Geodermatophilus sp. SYSU D00965]